MEATVVPAAGEVVLDGRVGFVHSKVTSDRRAMDVAAHRDMMRVYRRVSDGRAVRHASGHHGCIRTSRNS